MEKKKEILKSCMENGFLIEKDILDNFLNFDYDFFQKIIKSVSKIDIFKKVLSKSFFLDNYKIIDNINDNNFNIFLENIGIKNNNIKILSSLNINPKKINVEDFIVYFKNRYEQLQKILINKGINNVKSIRRASTEKDIQNIIVMISNKKITKNKNIIFEVEDLTGKAKVLVNESKRELFEKCKNILVDEVVSFNVSSFREIFFVNDVFFPDLYLNERKNSKNDVSMAVISDLHIGSNMFLEKSFLNFIESINGKGENIEQINILKKIKYLFIVGDCVDGVGVFSGQDRLLKIKEIKAQYEKLFELLKLIREDINIIICPGQHDATWIGEPQSAVGEEWAKNIYGMKNVKMVSNPAVVEIENEFKILMYHGASFHGIVENVPDIRLNYEHKNPNIVLKELLKYRHLSPLHGVSDYIPTRGKDFLVIEDVPDIVLTGDFHRPEASYYNNVLLIASSCWQSQTPFEEKVGNIPDPCKVPIFNLKSREINIIDFFIDEAKNE